MSFPSNSLSRGRLPKEILLDVFSFVPAKQLLELKTICREHNNLIGTDKSSQVRIAELYIIKKQPQANIPLNDLKHFLCDTNLVLEVNGDMSVFHLTNDLTPAIPWIKELIVKNCGATHLAKLADLLKGSKQLSTLWLYKCQLDKTCLPTLQGLTLDGNKKKTELNLCCCDMEDELTEINNIPIENAYQFDIENQETGVDDMEEFELQVSDASASLEDVIRAFDCLKTTLRAGVITFLWHALLKKEGLEPRDYIADQARLFIEQNPHHPAVAAAVSKIKQKYSKNCISS